MGGLRVEPDSNVVYDSDTYFLRGSCMRPSIARFILTLGRFAGRRPALAVLSARLGELEEILKDFKIRTTQEAIYLEIKRHVDVRFL